MRLTRAIGENWRGLSLSTVLPIENSAAPCPAKSSPLPNMLEKPYSGRSLPHSFFGPNDRKRDLFDFSATTQDKRTKNQIL